MNIDSIFDRFATKITKATGSSWAFIISFILILLWGSIGPLFSFSDTWQLYANTGTTLITFLMVFIIQYSQNKDTKALHMKIDELIKANKDADNKLRGIEKLSEREILNIKDKKLE